MDSTLAPIQIKGIREGLLVTLNDGEWPEQRAALFNSIDNQPAFFHGARLVLDVGGQVLHVAELNGLRDLLSERGVSLWAILSESPVTEQTAQNLGLATRLSKARPPEIKPAPEPEKKPENAALWIQQTLRSGQKITYEGNIVVMGDVNPGAEILASGSVIVWGRLRGVVHAGAQGDDKAMVCALELNPQQLRIAGEIAISPARKGKSQPEIARLKDGQIEAGAWQA